MPDWQVTGTTIYCDAVDDEVTVLVFKDWSIECTGYVKYGASGSDAIQLLKKKSRRTKQKLECDGPECRRMIQYKEKLQAEETEKG